MRDRRVEIHRLSGGKLVFLLANRKDEAARDHVEELGPGVVMPPGLLLLHSLELHVIGIHLPLDRRRGLGVSGLANAGTWFRV